MLTMTTGSPRMSADQTVRMAVKTTSENPVEFVAGEYRTQSITREFPILALRCYLKGTATPNTGSVGVASFGILNLIKKLTVSRNGNEPIYANNGHALKYLSILQTGRPVLEVAPPTAGGSFMAEFVVKFDVGGYNSLLDASIDQSLDIGVDWGQVSDGLTGDIAVSNVRLEIKPEVIAGAKAGELGGKQTADMRYLKQYALVASKPVEQSQDDFTFDLTSGRGYHGLTLFAFSDGALDDDIIERVRIDRADSRHITYDREELQAANFNKYRLGSKWVGVYDLPFIRDGHREHTLSIDPTQAMRVICKVAHPGTTDRVELVQQYFRA